ncbi:MAG TPA: CAP domain-containing protein [Clostridia bacterium]|nr:CAP domain-containing protein [Clostridia bacterium]
MKRKIAILAAMAVLIMSSTCYAASAVGGVTTELALEKVGDDTATVAVSKLNLREGPSTNFPSICKLEKGQALTIMGKLGDWYAVYDSDTGTVGAVDGRYITFGNENAVTASKNTSTMLKKTPGKETAPGKGTTPASIELNLSEDEQKLLDLVNKARAEKKLTPLVIDENLMKVARIKAKDMIENNYFSHQSPTYGSPFDMMRQYDNTFKSAGENIAGNKTVEGAFKAWMSSDSHKKNILNTGFNITGIGVEESATYGKVIVQQFIGK